MNWKMIFKTTIIIGVLAEIICGLTDPRAKIDWHKVVPVQDLPGFWKDKDIRFTPISFDKRERVVGGDFADPGQFPFQVALVLDFQGEFVFCGGCVISDVSLKLFGFALINFFLSSDGNTNCRSLFS